MTDDIRLIALFFARDEDAIVQTHKQYGTFCSRLARSFLTDSEDIEECVNETMLDVWNSIPPNRPKSFKSYIGRILRNNALSIYRRENAAKRSKAMTVSLSELETCIPSAESVEAQVETKELSAAIDAWLSTLRERDRMLFVRRYWYGDSVQALAAKAGISSNNMAQKLFGLRKRLKAYLEQRGTQI